MACNAEEPGRSRRLLPPGIGVKPDYAEVHSNLGNALKDQGKLEEAIACCRKALQLKPDYAEAHCTLGVALKEQGKLDEASPVTAARWNLSRILSRATTTWATP